ncbi:hypothetical protein F4774DRAFT_103560 [Daldinia eschscholtzii]|nr:hypothetical protein F4774DRAFT_103560 [Daldinia eschscholtzii]
MGICLHYVRLRMAGSSGGRSFILQETYLILSFHNSGQTIGRNMIIHHWSGSFYAEGSHVAWPSAEIPSIPNPVEVMRYFAGSGYLNSRCCHSSYDNPFLPSIYPQSGSVSFFKALDSFNPYPYRPFMVSFRMPRMDHRAIFPRYRSMAHQRQMARTDDKKMRSGGPGPFFFCSMKQKKILCYVMLCTYLPTLPKVTRYTLKIERLGAVRGTYKSYLLLGKCISDTRRM